MCPSIIREITDIRSHDASRLDHLPRWPAGEHYRQHHGAAVGAIEERRRKQPQVIGQGQELSRQLNLGTAFDPGQYRRLRVGGFAAQPALQVEYRSEEHTSELQ